MLLAQSLRRLCAASLLIALMLAIASCGSGSTTVNEASTAASTQPSTEPNESRVNAESQRQASTTNGDNSTKAKRFTLPEGCERPSPKIVAAIEEGLTVGGGGSLGNAYAVRSTDFDMVWMVAAEIEGEGLEDAIGVWATNDIREYGPIYAADNVAREFSDWGSGPVEATDNGVSEAVACFG